jgi:hypothetical protein
MALAQEIIDYVREQGGGAYRVPGGDVIGAIPKYLEDGVMEDIVHFFVRLPSSASNPALDQRLVQSRIAFKFISGVVHSVKEFEGLIHGSN